MKELKQYLEKHYTPQTAKAYQREITAYIGNVPSASKLAYKDIVQHIGELRDRYSNPGTINRIVASIKVYYDYLVHSGKRTDNPAKSIKLRDKRTRDIQLQDLFTSDELEKLLTTKEERYGNLEKRNKVLISLLIYQALKPAEIEALETGDINLEEATIHIKPSAKNNSRTLTLKANQILLFKKYIEEIRPKLLNKKQSESLIIGHRCEPIKADDITKHIKRSYSKIYSPRTINAQTIRQSVITNLLKAGHDLRIVQTFAGHKYPSSTERYKQDNLDALKAGVNQHHPIR